METSLTFQFIYPIPILDYENPSNPFINTKGYYQSFTYVSNFASLRNIRYDWKVIKYIEKKGISRLFDYFMNKSNEHFSGECVESSEFKRSSFIQKIGDNYYKYIFRIRIDNNHYIYDEYRGRKITIFDVLSSIIALFVPIRMIFLFIYEFYSTNFDNYKMIESILNKNKNKFYKEIKLPKNLELIQGMSSNKKENKENNDLKNSIPFIDSDNNNNENYLIINGSKNSDDDNEIEGNKNERILPKFSFIQFFFNNCYCNKCCKKNNFKKQEILQMCNTISMKYLSMDLILLNQMVIENLINDYKFNYNASIDDINNNELILQLKELIY